MINFTDFSNISNISFNTAHSIKSDFEIMSSYCQFQNDFESTLSHRV